MMALADSDLEHLAFSILHGTFNQDASGGGGCSCDMCRKLADRIVEICKEEASKFYAEHYPPPGGFL